MKKRRVKQCGALALGIALMSVGSVFADSVIGISFNDENKPVTDLGASEVAGFIRASNWNTVTNNSPVTAGLVYGDGTSAAVTLTTSGGHGNWYLNRDGSPSAGDEKLFSGVIDIQTSMSFTMAGLSFEEYDVYVYLRGENAARGGGFTIGSTTYYARGGAGIPVDETDYVLSTDTDYAGGLVVDQMDQGNVVKFSGLSGSDFTLAVQAYGDDINRSKVAGFQVVAVPEPATFGLIAVFGGAVLFIRRRFMI